MVFPLPWPLFVRGVRLSRFGPPASLSHHLSSSSLTPAGSVHKSRGDNVVSMWVHLRRWCVSCVWMLQRGNSGDGCVLTATLCKYDLRKGGLFVLSWARVRRSISSELLMWGGMSRYQSTTRVCLDITKPLWNSKISLNHHGMSRYH